MRYVIALFLFFIISTITLNTCLNVINQKNNIIYSQQVQNIKSQKQIQTYQKNIKFYTKQIKNQKNSLWSLTEQLNQAKDANKHLKYLGKFLITYYDLSYESCGKYPNDPAYGHTYSGAIATPNKTIAVDTSVIPLGSYVYINNVGCRIAEDIGGKIKGNHIDIFVNDFNYEKYQTHYTNVWIVK
jgi:3D (Asp-Asp-Asp) domain-containing protein